MRRWNGWGDEADHFPLKPEAQRFLAQQIGSGCPLPDATLESVLDQVPASRLPAHPLVSMDPEQRVRHARGQSLPDWLAMRSGNMAPFPDGVAFPDTNADVRALLQYAQQHDVELITYGGGSSVVGHINPRDCDRATLTVDMKNFNRLLHLDPTSQLATFGAGTPGPLLESQLSAQGYMLGHFPQSWELSTLGGWVASRSSGQQSLRYGRIEQLFAGATVETMAGTLTIPTLPASSAGPDLRELILGSEGRLGIITDVSVRISPLPEQEHFYVVFFPDWDSGISAVRTLAQARVPLSMMRLSNPRETWTQLKLAGHEHAISLLEGYLSLRGASRNKCMFTFGVTGSKADCKAILAQANRVLRGFGGVNTGTLLGNKWRENRFRSPYLRHALWELGYAVDTLETAVDWARVPATVDAIEHAIHNTLKMARENIHVFTHLSHIYGQGSSIYTTYVFRCGKTYAETQDRWRRMKQAASQAIIKQGGTISHQHGVGTDHAPYLKAEKGELGIATLRALCRYFDPSGNMNPGKLLPEDPSHDGH
ncbi:FAD-binding oxidoreductase [Ketobacter sp.]|uniref:FAD-binding oxidoreductase n=1 Tax=Ketobacter sp. TaxID=2083498 RepID=UPI000F28CB85|nr:FAD-binding oxidoreductase [Ketobacter sp.]RLT98008.1 MAG: FAD-binding oxidoreductase [Ketobacter sp.]